MKLNIMGCRAFCERKGIKNYAELSKVLELSVEVISLLGEETLNGFKSKYVEVGNKLY